MYKIFKENGKTVKVIDKDGHEVSFMDYDDLSEADRKVFAEETEADRLSKATSMTHEVLAQAYVALQNEFADLRQRLEDKEKIDEE